METVDLFAVEIYGDGSFSPGEIIYGDVYLKTIEELTLREIRIEFYGEAKVFWTEAPRKKRLGMRDYTNYEQYLNIAATVYGKAPGQIGANPVLSPGEHSFPFEFRLPEENLPSTFEGKHGYVKYWLKAILDRPWKDDMTVVEPFTVTERVNVNLPEFLRPSQIQEDRNMGCLCCVSGPLSVTVRADRGAYCSGELMTVTVYANNQTSHRILGVELELIQDTLFIASGGKKTFTTEIIATVTKAGKTPNAEGNDFFEMVPVLIPSLTPTMKSSRCIKISYQIKVNKELKLRGIRLEFHGKASIHWSESTGSGENRRTRHYRNSETYIDTLATLFGKGPGQAGDDPVLQPGDYSYPFQFLIPNQNMPTSVEGRHGYVRYWLKGVIDRPWRFDITTTAVFTMLEYVDINTFPLLQPCQMSEDRNVGCLCCKSGPLSITVYTDRGGYCPGESIGVSAVINNHSNNEILGLEIHLIQVTVYIASCGKQRHCEDKVAAMVQEGVKPHEETRMPMVAFPIPSLPPSMLTCKCMRMSYVLRLKVRVKGAFNSNLNIPITIGSVPYRPPMQPQYPQPAAGNFGGPPPPLAGFSEPSGYPAPSPQFGDGTQPYPNYAPPSYAECVSGGASITNEGESGKALGDSSFTPMYPFVNNYQFPSAPPAPFPQDPKSQ